MAGKLTSQGIPNISRAIQYPMPVPVDDPWMNRMLTAYLKDIGIVGRRALAAKESAGE